MIVIGLVGMPSSGKSTIAKSLKANVIHIGDFIWEYLRQHKIRRTQETGNMASLYFWAEYKDIPLAEWVYNQIIKSKDKVFVVDGIRTLEEVQFFKNKFKNFKLVAILASPKVRKAREKKRKRFSKIDFEVRDKEELTIGVGEVIALSDYFIDGNQTKKEVIKQANKIFKKIVGKKSL